MTKEVKLSPRFTSRVQTAVAAAALVGVAASLSACGPEPDTTAHAYTSAAQCTADGVYSRSACEQMDTAARRMHRDTAPRYENRRDCEEDFGREKCETRQVTSSGGGVVYIHSPAYAGYYGGYSGSYVPPSNGNSGGSTASGARGLSSAGTVNAPAPGPLVSTPVYRTVDGAVSTATGDHIPSGAFTRSGTPARAASVSAHPGAPMAVSRGMSVVKSGGFGASVRGGGMSMGG